MTWREHLNRISEQLKQSGVPDAELEAWYLLEETTGMNRTSYLLHREEEPGPEREPELTRMQNLADKRATRYPLSYLTGYRNFCGLDFKVSEAVLIPRQDTECLVEELLPLIAGKRILDMCTGSGCIAISLLVLGYQQGRAPESVTGVDISEAALAVAKENGVRLRAEHMPHLEWRHSDLFENVEDRYDVIVSNPPYICSNVIDTLEPEVKEYEPRLALDGSEDGLFFYRRLVCDAPQHLSRNGILAFEIGYDQGEAVSEMMKQQGFRDVYIKKDLAGLDRIVIGYWM